MPNEMLETIIAKEISLLILDNDNSIQSEAIAKGIRPTTSAKRKDVFNGLSIEIISKVIPGIRGSKKEKMVP
jgi:hypothetical protein